jgi:hypothetical protein
MNKVLLAVLAIVCGVAVVFALAMMGFIGYFSIGEVSVHEVPEATPEPAFTQAPPTPPEQTATPQPSPTPQPSQAPQPSATQSPEQGEFVPATPEDISGFAVWTDRQVYRPQDYMTITVSVNASRAIPGAYFNLLGVKSSRGYTYVSNETRMDIPAGESAFNFTFQLPFCSPCSGLSYGNHTYAVRVSQNGHLLRSFNGSIEMAPPQE